ncbi:uncharacterized protein LOC135154837 [Lytechinus pictus]|uniref:uncharacterized protein LOC135154837 n=1 Tax=Lytechinus pictus TaxID=7653 RepID=UPI0030B9D881
MENTQKILLSLCVGCLLFASFIWRVAGDVPDGFVRTDLHKSIKKGDDIVLNCEFYRSPVAVYWKKGDKPETADNLLIWVDRDGVGQISGPCTEDSRYGMASNYTLTIRDARIEDEGRYICRVSNYLGILIYNQTDVKIFAPPQEPFPTINQCTDTVSPGLNTTEPSCRVLTNTTIVLTCSVTNYYPQIDIFFLHGSQKMNAVAKEWGNDDGTKNKSISIEAQPSQTQYICVASNIPGTGEQQAATIFVESSTGMHSVTGTSRAFTTDITKEDKSGNHAAKIVVPLFVLILLGAIAVFLRLKRIACFRQNTFDGTTTTDRTIARNDGQESIPMIEQAHIDGDISFYELWSLAYDTPSSDMKKLHQALLNLGIKDATEEMRAPEVYNLLCKWKDEHRKNKHANKLQSALQNANFGTRWQNLRENRKRTDEKVSQATVEQIITDIVDPQKIQQLLFKLYAGQADLPNLHGGIKDPNEAMKLFMEWRCSRFSENPNAVLSLALGKSGCSEISKNFFAGMISFPELWTLSRSMTEHMVEANATLKNLSLGVGRSRTDEEIYVHLCDWKEKNTTVNQGKLLLDALTKANFKEAWKDIMELREKRTNDVADKTIEHILWQIKDPDKLRRFLQKLTGKVPSFGSSQIIQQNTIQEATQQVVEWKHQDLDENPYILLSHALEKTECKPTDRSFFKVPHHLVGDLIECEVEGFADRLTSRHVKSLLQCVDMDSKEDAIVTANNATLFNTDAMVNEWIRQATCSNYEKRLKLHEAVVSIGRQDIKDELWTDLNPGRDLGIQHGTRSSGLVKHVKGTKS